MACFMRFCKKIKQLTWLLAAVLLTALVYAGVNHAHIKSAEMQLREDVWYLQADLEIQLGRGLEDALNKGIELVFLYEFQITKPQKYWFDDEVLTERKAFSLSYYALTKQYLVQGDQHYRAFDSLSDAKRDLAQLRDWRLTTRATLDKVENYQAALKMHLDRSKLPKALQLDALGESDWELVTPTFSWWLKESGR